MRILVVDDLPDQASTLGELLRFYGHDVRTALHAAAALRACESFQPDVVVTDVEMPGVSGYDLVKELRATLPGRPFYITISGHRYTLNRTGAEGLDYSFLKPVEPAVLL